MRSAVMTVFAWPGLGSSTKLSWAARKQALYFLTNFSDTQSSPYMVIIRQWMVAGLTPPTVRNQITPRCSSIVEFCNVNAILSSHALPRQLDGALYKSLALSCACGRPLHAPIHGGDSNHIPRCLAMFSHSSIDIYLNGDIFTTFCTFSFEHPSYFNY